MVRHLVTTVVLIAVAFAVFQPWLPVHLSTVTSGSMSPTMHEGDAYLVVDVDEVAVGDVVTFYSATEDAYVTHRVVEARADGYVTRGDANPSTDQAGGHPLVTDEAVVGTVLTVYGSVVRVPFIGGLLLAVSENLAAAVLVAATMVAGVALIDDDTENRVATTSAYVGPALVACVLVGFVAVLAATRDLSVVYVVTNTGSATTAALGQPMTQELTLHLEASPFTAVLVEADGMTVLAHTVEGGVRRLLVEYPAQSSVGAYDAHVRVYSYPRTLPAPVLWWLHRVDPLAACTGSVLAGFAPIAGIAWLFGDEVPVRPPRNRWLSRYWRS